MSIERKVPSRFAALGARPPLFWIKLVAILAATTYLAWLSFIHAVASITWRQNPDTALYYVPDHPLALSRKADELFAQRQDPATLAKVEAMAKQSLRGGALNPVAIRLLGYVADARGDTKKARHLMLLSQKVSRRDLGTQLWLIEDAVARDDKRAALNHYDIAMRATPSSFPILFPTLTGALGDPDVRIKVYGVSFHSGDLDALLNGVGELQPQLTLETPVPSKRGRKQEVGRWADFGAALALFARYADNSQLQSTNAIHKEVAGLLEAAGRSPLDLRTVKQMVDRARFWIDAEKVAEASVG